VNGYLCVASVAKRSTPNLISIPNLSVRVNDPVLESGPARHRSDIKRISGRIAGRRVRVRAERNVEQAGKQPARRRSDDIKSPGGPFRQKSTAREMRSGETRAITETPGPLGRRRRAFRVLWPLVEGKRERGTIGTGQETSPVDRWGKPWR